jgi:hypothetical protein
VYHRAAEWENGVLKKSLNVALPCGVLIRGQVTEEASGKPVAGAILGFLPRERDNPLFRGENRPSTLGGEMKHSSGPDGSFQLTVPAGPGHLIVRGPTLDYVHLESTLGELEGGKPHSMRFYPDALLALDVKPGAAPQAVAVKLKRGETIKGQVVGPDGKPVARAQLVCRSYLPFTYYFSQSLLPVREGTFELQGCDPEKTYTIYILDKDHDTGAVATLSAKKAAGKPVTARLTPCGSASVRFMDPKGKPYVDHDFLGKRPLLVVELIVTPGSSTHLYEDLAADTVIVNNLDRDRYGAVRTDATGRMTVPLLIPGATYRITVGEGDKGWVNKQDFTVESGKLRQLPDVIIEPEKG